MYLFRFLCFIFLIVYFFFALVVTGFKYFDRDKKEKNLTSYECITQYNARLLVPAEHRDHQKIRARAP